MKYRFYDEPNGTLWEVDTEQLSVEEKVHDDRDVVPGVLYPAAVWDSLPVRQFD